MSVDTAVASSPGADGLGQACDLLETQPPESRSSATRILGQLLQNLIDAPENPKYRRVRVSNVKIKALLGIPGSEAFLRALGFEDSVDSSEGSDVAFLEIPEVAALGVRDGIGVAALESLRACAAAGIVEFALPAGFFAEPNEAICRAVAVVPARSFGPFQEKTLQCNLAARKAIDILCAQGGFTQAWAAEPYADLDGQEFYTMTKVPAIILVKLMLGLPQSEEAAVQSLIGAYGICMAPQVRTCMNVVVGRRSNDSGGFVLDKFSLYYPSNATIPSEWGDSWDLLQGFSFRTAALSGSLNRAGLRGIARKFPCDDHGLVIDFESAFEDCAYVRSVPGETNQERKQRISGMVAAMVAAFGGHGGCLAPSYDPAEQAQGLTALESEWNLLLATITKHRRDAEV